MLTYAGGSWSSAARMLRGVLGVSTRDEFDREFARVAVVDWLQHMQHAAHSASLFLFDVGEDVSVGGGEGNTYVFLNLTKPLREVFLRRGFVRFRVVFRV